MPKVWNRKGAQALFLLFGVLVSAWASGAAEAAVWHWALALGLLAGGLYPATVADRTWIGAAVAGLVSWTIFHTLFIAESYSAGGLFQPLFLATGFALGRRATFPDINRPGLDIASSAVAAIVCYALLACVFAGFPAVVPFETPAALAALTNMALLPVLVYALWGPLPTLARVIVLALFFAGLIGASSRGGWIGLLVGLGFAVIFFRGRLPHTANALRVALSLCIGVGLVAMIRIAGPFLAPYATYAAGRGWGGLGGLFLSGSALEMDSSLSRLELYAVAFDAAREHILLGAGYLSFAQLLEAGRDRVPSYGAENVTFFVHNDYLQALLELGLPGLCGLLAVVLAPLVLLLRYRDRLQPADALLGCACASGLAAMTFQATVDFPFYIPVCLAMFGLLLGVLDARFAGARIGLIQSVPGRGVGWSAWASVRRVVLATGLVLLLVPLMAEWSFAYGAARWRKGMGEEAAYGFELARRLQPADWRYAWYAGKFWAAQAAATRNPEAARLADESFAHGFASNPLEVKNLLGRIELRRSIAHLLAQPSTPEELEAWSVRALAMAPRNPRVRMERVLVLDQSGKVAEARTEAAKFSLDEPSNRSARMLANRLARRAP